MKAIGVTDQAAGRAGITLVQRPEPETAGNDVLVEVHASGFTPGELTWPSTWPDRRDRAPSIPGHELAGVVSSTVASHTPCSPMARSGTRCTRTCTSSVRA